MDKRIARVAVLLAMVGWNLIAPQPAQAQLGTGSLIVTVTSPASGTTVAGTISVTASASDNVRVVGVQFLLDGLNAGAEVTAAPYSVSWNTTTASNGSHSLTAVARDAAGNRATSVAVAVTVSNRAPPHTTTPMVSISSPTSRASGSRPLTP